mmetsp:Transcript_16253/g.52595  ORF Transcript_16253/g.52595 Transcript_16253/m.52595 type:complete len:268 (+) Transcript_16253:195-998(+)
MPMVSTAARCIAPPTKDEYFGAAAAAAVVTTVFRSAACAGHMAPNCCVEILCGRRRSLGLRGSWKERMCEAPLSASVYETWPSKCCSAAAAAVAHVTDAPTDVAPAACSSVMEQRGPLTCPLAGGAGGESERRSERGTSSATAIERSGAPLLRRPIASSAAEAPAVFETESCSRASDVRGTGAEDASATGASETGTPACTTPPEWSNPVWVPSRGWCGSQGGRPAHVLKTANLGAGGRQRAVCSEHRVSTTEKRTGEYSGIRVNTAE